jgi:hypothetical protein
MPGHGIPAVTIPKYDPQKKKPKNRKQEKHLTPNLSPGKSKEMEVSMMV